LAAEVKGACEEVGASAPTNFQYVDSRGLNRALLGDYPGAIKDFEYFVKATADPKAKAQRQKYLEILEQGQNPFDDKELKDIL
jgi:regulator of sirC expression with transglutaminase-like and TPR domain